MVFRPMVLLCLPMVCRPMVLSPNGLSPKRFVAQTSGDHFLNWIKERNFLERADPINELTR